MINDDIRNIRKELKEYFDIRLDIIRLQIAEQLSLIFSKIILFIVAGFMLFFILLFLSISAALLLGSVLKSNTAGFLVVSGFYTLLLIIFLAMKKRLIEKPVIQAMLKLLFPETSHDEEDE